MSPDKQRTEIAKACGWQSIKRCSRNLVCSADGVTFKGTKDPLSANYPRVYEIIPDYLHDLNAMHAAEKVLTQAQDYDYRTETLPKVCGDSSGFTALTATAAQRAEAFLCTVGKWKDEQ